MQTEKDFHLMLGETIKYCQCIEHDIKMIYAGIRGGNIRANMIAIEKETLGSAVTLLKELDNMRSKPYFTYADYGTLFGITKIRNYWAHQGYVDYIYQPRETVRAKFDAQFQKLTADHDKMKRLHEITEGVRLDFFKSNT